MQIYGIYVLYRNIPIYLELNRYMIIYGEKYCCWFFKKDFLAANESSGIIFAEK